MLAWIREKGKGGGGGGGGRKNFPFFDDPSMTAVRNDGDGEKRK